PMQCKIDTGEWKQGANLDTDLPAVVDNIICAKNEPNILPCLAPTFKMTCPSEARTASKCKNFPSVAAGTTEVALDCSSVDPSLKVYTSADGKKWALAESLHCDTIAAAWVHKTTPVAVLATDSFVCAESAPDPPACTTLITACDKAKADAPTLQCSTPTGKESSVCPSSENLYSLKDGDKIWEEEKEIICDINDKWMNNQWMNGAKEIVALTTNVICAN
ncbi:hypothetical protein PMAYCL1PPCAC_21815, partial [Pristionchus mayeri]